jgi:hypothetical protein
MQVLTLRPRRPSTARGIMTVGVLHQMRSIMLRPYAERGTGVCLGRGYHLGCLVANTDSR